MNMSPWISRPAEVSNLLNPAYMALLLNRVCDGYRSESKQGLPFALAYLALPMLLHSGTAEELPKTIKTKVYAWIQEHPEILVSFPSRARSLAPYIREAILFGINQRALHIDPDGRVLAAPLDRLKHWERKPCSKESSKRAHLLGRLYAQANDVASLFAMCGVRP